MEPSRYEKPADVAVTQDAAADPGAPNRRAAGYSFRAPSAASIEEDEIA